MQRLPVLVSVCLSFLPIEGFALLAWARENCLYISTVTETRDYLIKALWLPRMDSNHDKVIQSHLSLLELLLKSFAAGSHVSRNVEISFDSFRGKFRLDG